MKLILTKIKNSSKYNQNLAHNLHLLTCISIYFYLFLYYRHNSPIIPLKALLSPKMPGKIKHIVGKARQKQVYFIGKEPHIPRLCPIKMQAKYPKDFFNFAPDPRKYLVQLLLFLRKRPPTATFIQHPTKSFLLPTLLAYFSAIISLVRKYGFLLSFKEFFQHLGIMHVGRSAYKFRHKLRLWRAAI